MKPSTPLTITATAILPGIKIPFWNQVLYFYGNCNYVLYDMIGSNEIQKLYGIMSIKNKEFNSICMLKTTKSNYHSQSTDGTLNSMIASKREYT